MSAVGGGRLIILSGPSGVGKDTVIDAWRERDARVQRVVAYTTRTPREGEVSGVDYHFVTPEAFHQKAESGEFLEFKEVHGNHYATPLKDTEELLAQGKLAILKIDVKGALDVIPLRPDALTVFLLPPDFAELQRRIEVRGKDDPAAVTRRLATAAFEMSQAPKYQHQIVNDLVDRVVEELSGLTTGPK